MYQINEYQSTNLHGYIFQPVSCFFVFFHCEIPIYLPVSKRQEIFPTCVDYIGISEKWLIRNYRKWRR